jgi:hypothetical protein
MHMRFAHIAAYKDAQHTVVAYLLELELAEMLLPAAACNS